jgi:hypothetical protein|tara:strand:+ start:105 stop:215 length:111 start_codon:yes stop_codon:yes gene_type:complete
MNYTQRGDLVEMDLDIVTEVPEVVRVLLLCMSIGVN